MFTNRVEDMRLQDLAEMDVKELVHQVRAQPLAPPLASLVREPRVGWSH